MSTTFVETEHPRGHVKNAGAFSDKEHSQPETGLPQPARLDQFFDTLEDKLAAMREEIESSVTALADDENWNAYLETTARFHNYSFGNQMLIAIQNPDATRVAGKRVWESLGRKVKPFADRGNGISLLAPKRIRVAAKDAAGNPITDQDGKPVKESRTVGFTSCTVYDISQTEGPDLPTIQRELTETPPEGFIQDLEAAITSKGFAVVYKDDMGKPGLFGQTSPSNHTVTIDATLTPGSRAQVLAHELGHIAAGHLETIGDYHTGPGGQRGSKEIEAESISHVMLRLAGMKTPGDVTGTYIAGWARVQSDDPDAVQNTGEKVSRCVKELLESHSWSNLAAG